MVKKVFFLVVIFGVLYSSQAQDDEIMPDSTTVELARMLGKDVFELNGVSYLQPTVEMINAVSNSRFFNKAYVPTKVDKPYFRFGVMGMSGMVPSSHKTYSPEMPQEEFSADNLGFDGLTFNYGRIDFDPTNPADFQIIVTDTAGLMFAALKGALYNGVKSGDIKVPGSAPTALGSGKVNLELPSAVLLEQIKNLSLDLGEGLGEVKIWDYLPEDMRDSVASVTEKFPNVFPLPEGGDLNYVSAFVPQLEFGSFMGTEFLIRFIPPVNLGEDIGDFAFWGFGIKHSISQYFNRGETPDKRHFDLAVQAVYQGSHLENSVGVTNADLNADAVFWNFNIHASKSFEDIIDVYTGVSYEYLSIKSKYTYTLPMTIQWQLGLIDKKSDENPNYEPEPPEHPGDTEPQTANVELEATNLKWIIGLSKEIGPVQIFADFSLSEFQIFSGGIIYTF